MSLAHSTFPTATADSLTTIRISLVLKFCRTREIFIALITVAVKENPPIRTPIMVWMVFSNVPISGLAQEHLKKLANIHHLFRGQGGANPCQKCLLKCESGPNIQGDQMQGQTYAQTCILFRNFVPGSRTNLDLSIFMFNRQFWHSLALPICSCFGARIPWEGPKVSSSADFTVFQKRQRDCPLIWCRTVGLNTTPVGKCIRGDPVQQVLNIRSKVLSIYPELAVCKSANRSFLKCNRWSILVPITLGVICQATFSTGPHHSHKLLVTCGTAPVRPRCVLLPWRRCAPSVLQLCFVLNRV